MESITMKHDSTCNPRHAYCKENMTKSNATFCKAVEGMCPGQQMAAPGPAELRC